MTPGRDRVAPNLPGPASATVGPVSRVAPARCERMGTVTSVRAGNLPGWEWNSHDSESAFKLRTSSAQSITRQPAMKQPTIDWRVGTRHGLSGRRRGSPEASRLSQAWRLRQRTIWTLKGPRFVPGYSSTTDCGMDSIGRTSAVIWSRRRSPPYGPDPDFRMVAFGYSCG